jgi:hypothetical protein
MTPPTFQKVLPNKVPVTLSVEKVFKKDEKDKCFRLECRICDGEFSGDMINLWFYREKLAGGPNSITSKLLATLVPGKSLEEIHSWMLQGKIFESTPWTPPDSKHQMHGRFKLVGANDLAL